jgi:hypothetical protein
MIKKITILGLLFLSNYISTQAQCWDPQIPNTITTDWRAANTSNTWDWTQELFTDFYIKNRTNPVSRYSPFWTPQSSTGTNLFLTDFQVYVNRDDKDFHPEDGWELLIKNFGEFSVDGSKDVANPFFALYNRYTGKVRAFLLVADRPTSPQNGALLKAKFGGGRFTALWQHMKPIGQAVESFDKDLYAELNNPYSNEIDRWLFSEFVVAYDPCTCLDLGDPNALPFINFEYFLVSSAAINATIDGTIAEQVSQNGGPTKSNPSFALNDLDDAKKVVEAGQKGYKTWGKYKTWYNTQLNNFTDSMYRDQLWQGLEASKELSQEFYEDVLQDLIGQTTCDYDDFINGNYTIDPTAFMAPKDNTLLNKNYSTLKAFASIFPYVGAALSVFDLLVDDGGTTMPAPKGPTVFDVSLKLDGEITRVNPIQAHQFFTPGFTTNSSQYNWIPTYNNILGVFNVLELPDFEYFEIRPTVTNLTESVAHLGNQCKRDYSDFHNLDGANDVIFKQYKPKEKLKYVLNPASNLEVESVEAAIVLEYLGQDKLFIRRPADFNSIKAIPYHPRVLKANRNDTFLSDAWSGANGPLVDFTPYPQNGDFINSRGLRLNNGSANPPVVQVLTELVQPGLGSSSVVRINDINNHTDLTYDVSTPNYPVYDSSEIQFRTDYLPNTCFDKLSFTVMGNDNFGKVYAKVVVRLRHKNQPELDPVTLIFSYDLTPKLQTATKRPETGSYSTTVWGRDWSLTERCCWKCGTDMTFTSAEIENYRYLEEITLNGTPYNWDFFKPHDITYNGEASLTAIGTITVPDNSVILPNTILRAGGAIDVGENVIIGSGSQIYSEVKIDVDKGTEMESNVILEIAGKGSIKYDCSDYNYQSLEMGSDDITAFCGSQVYKQRALFKRDPSDVNNNDTTLNNLSHLDYKIYPNPNNGIFELEFITSSEDIKLEVIDAFGRVIQELTKPIGLNTVTIDISGSRSGIYFIKIAGSNSPHHIKRVMKY